MPVVMQRGKTLIGLFALDVTTSSIIRVLLDDADRAEPERLFTEGFFQVAAKQNPKPQTLALTAEDAEFSRNACEGARENAKKYGLKSATTRLSRRARPISRRSSARCRPPMPTSSFCSYPLSSVGIVLSANELDLTPKMLGGAMVGLQATVFKDKLKSKLNGIVNYETWVPSPKLMAPAETFFKTYQEQAKAAGVDPLGYYLGGWGYAYFQLLGEAIEGAKTLTTTNSPTTCTTTVHDHHGQRFRFDAVGEWTQATTMQVQYHGITDAANLETWRGMSYQTVLTPADRKTGEMIYPYEKAK